MAVKSMKVEIVKIFLHDVAGLKLVADIIFPYLVKVVFEHFLSIQLLQRN
tara:strand:+ start:349 stop:498 length:150 start_codon:yes stop_codon:yes gene_type:complete